MFCLIVDWKKILHDSCVRVRRPRCGTDVSSQFQPTNSMNENHIFVGASDAALRPRRVISIEETVRGGMCRSCKQTLNVGEARIKVAYPNVIVQFAARVGSPSFYMHPSCFETQPVDFLQMGSTAYKETLPIQGFAVNPEVDIIGYDRFPELHHCFVKSRTMYLQQQGALLSSTADHLTGQGIILIESNGSDINQTDNLAHNDSPMCHPEKDEEVEVIETADRTRSPTINKLCPQKRRAQCLRPTTAPFAKITYDADIEDEDLAYRFLLKSHDDGAYDKMCFQLSDEQPTHHQRGSQNPTISQKKSNNNIVLKEPCVRVSACCACSCHCSTERQWASPQAAAEILGISTAILRSLAYARAIPIFVRPSGHRVYHIPSIRKYMTENTLQPKLKRNKDAHSGTPDTVGTVWVTGDHWKPAIHSLCSKSSSFYIYIPFQFQ